MLAVEPAQLILASAIYAASTSSSSSLSDLHGLGSLRAQSGCKTVDEALCGGLSYGLGGVCCISGENATAKEALSLQFLVSHLLNKHDSHAAVIDTTGTFDILGLHAALLSRLSEQRSVRRAREESRVNVGTALTGTGRGEGVDDEGGGGGGGGREGKGDGDDEDILAVAEKALQKVKIMRVFDFVGLVEAVAEIREDIEASGRATATTAENSAAGTVGIEGRSIKKDAHPSSPAHVDEVADSQDEDEDDEDMLLDPSPALDEQPVSNESRERQKNAREEERVGMIIIDNITRIVSPLMKSDYVRGHSLLTSTMRTLTTLARSHNLSVIILNAAVSIDAFAGTASSTTTGEARPPLAVPAPAPGVAASSNPSSGHDRPSIFASVTSRPALGKTFPYFLDLHLFLSTWPPGELLSEDSGGSGAGASLQTANSRAVHVVEVVADRWEGRVGRWAPFVVDGGCQLKSFVV